MQLHCLLKGSWGFVMRAWSPCCDAAAAVERVLRAEMLLHICTPASHSNQCATPPCASTAAGDLRGSQTIYAAIEEQEELEAPGEWLTRRLPLQAVQRRLRGKRWAVRHGCSMSVLYAGASKARFACSSQV